MDNSLYFVISAVILSFTMLASCYMRYRIPTKDNKLLIVLIWFVTVSSGIDLFLGMGEKYFALPKSASLIINTVYALLRHMVMVLYALYVTSTTRKKAPIWVEYVLTALNLYGTALIIGNIKLRWLFDIDERGGYVAMQQVYMYYVVAISFVIFTVQHFIRFGNVVDWSKKVSLYMFVSIPYLCAWLQYQVKELRIESFGMMVAMLWVYLNAPRIDRMMDSATGALNQYAFSKKVVAMLETKQRGYVVVLRFRDKVDMQNRYGLEVYKKLMREASHLVSLKVGREKVYYLQDGRFAIEITKNDEEEAKKVSNELLKILQKNWKIYGKDIEVWLVAALLVFPEDVRDINDIYNYLEYLEIMPSLRDGNVYEGKHLDIAYMRRYDEIERAIDRALQYTNFEVYFQPIYGTKERRIVAAEALLRMYDEEMGFVSPEEFIPIAEKNGKIVQIGHLVIENVCQFLKREDIKKYGLRYIEVNLSVIECMQKNLPEELASIMERYGVDGSQINLEITETALVENQEILLKNMQKINEMGITFSLDDYGTGYSTITYMMTMPFKIVKIDKSILWSSFENEKAMIALCASINMIKDMEMEIVVEGIETEEMANKLSELGCEYLQGFYFSRPLPKEEFLEFLQKPYK